MKDGWTKLGLWVLVVVQAVLLIAYVRLDGAESEVVPLSDEFADISADCEEPCPVLLSAVSAE